MARTTSRYFKCQLQQVSNITLSFNKYSWKIWANNFFDLIYLFSKWLLCRFFLIKIIFQPVLKLGVFWKLYKKSNNTPIFMFANFRLQLLPGRHSRVFYTSSYYFCNFSYFMQFVASNPWLIEKELYSRKYQLMIFS